MSKIKVGRNDPCYCGSGKKYKKCCLLKVNVETTTTIINNDDAPPIKISDAIIKIAEPLIKKYQEQHRVTVLIQLAIIAWNMSFSSGNMREDIEGVLINAIPEEIDAVGTVTIIEIVDMLIERKNKIFPNINFAVVNHKISIDNNGVFNLDISSSFVDTSKLEAKNNEILTKAC